MADRSLSPWSIRMNRAPSSQVSGINPTAPCSNQEDIFVSFSSTSEAFSRSLPHPSYQSISPTARSAPQSSFSLPPGALGANCGSNGGLIGIPLNDNKIPLVTISNSPLQMLRSSSRRRAMPVTRFHPPASLHHNQRQYARVLCSFADSHPLGLNSASRPRLDRIIVSPPHLISAEDPPEQAYSPHDCPISHAEPRATQACPCLAPPGTGSGSLRGPRALGSSGPNISPSPTPAPSPGSGFHRNELLYRETPIPTAALRESTATVR